MSGLIYDETALVDSQMYKYNKFLHSRINKYTGDSRTLVTYWNLNDQQTTISLGMNTHYQILGKDSPLRFNQIENMVLLGLSQLSPEDSQSSSTDIRNYSIKGDAFVIPGTVMPKENDFFILRHVNMNHMFRVTNVTQDGLNTDGSYRISYELFSTEPKDYEHLCDQTVKKLVMDLQTIGGEDLTPVIGKEDYDYRSRIIKMVDDMIENYIANYYDDIHNCLICRLNGHAVFDLCGNYFMAKHGILIRDNATKNIVLNANKIRDSRLEYLYQKSPYKWIERDAPIRYIDTFKYHLVGSYNFTESSFAKYGTEIDIMIPNDAWCDSPECKPFFPIDVMNLLEEPMDSRTCSFQDCRYCEHRQCCDRHIHIQRFDYISLIHDYIHGKLTDLHKLSLYTGDQLFDNPMSETVYLWTPIIVYIIKQVLKIK